LFGADMAKVKKKIPVGQRLSLLRKKSKITLEELSERTGLTVKHLSNIEDGIDFAPVGDILKISRELLVNPDMFLENTREKKNKNKEEIRKREESYQYTLLTPESKNMHMRSFRVTIPPKSDHPKVNYQHTGEELIYVLNGEVEIKIGKKIFHLKKDDTYHFNSGIKHSLRNPCDEETVLIVTVYTP
jgi:transcriptional regulator with XRE-family HTH domain